MFPERKGTHMGFPPRLNGKHTPLPPDETETCPNCGRNFPVYHIVSQGKQVVKECPFCDYPIKNKVQKNDKSQADKS